LKGESDVGISFEDMLKNYARLGLLYGLGFDQRPRPLYIDSHQVEDPALLIPTLAREAYALDAKTVDVQYRYPELEREMFAHAPTNFKTHVPSWVAVRAKEIVDCDGARIALNGNGELGVMDSVDPTYPSGFRAAIFKANEPFTTRRIKMLQPWSILDVPTAAWANKLRVSIDDLWQFLFAVTGADQRDSVGYALGVSDKLHRRCALLNGLRICTLHFIGEGTDLKVGLTPRARWIGGRTEAEDGTRFGPNWPSFEVFTTPDWRRTEGTVRITMPSVINGPIVDGLSVTFEGGRIVAYTAERGGDAFKGLIGHDAGASQLGEIALVGLDSPLASYVEPHFCVLLDENKRCHFAVGKGFAAGLEGGPNATAEELAELGCNVSDVHHDIMISDGTTSLCALDENGKVLTQLMKHGHWLGEFK
jgi:aminopeptidase